MGEDEKELIEYVRFAFGYHGGVGDPPDDDTIKAILRSAEEYREKVA